MTYNLDLSRRRFLTLSALATVGVATGCGIRNSDSSAAGFSWLNEETDPPTVQLVKKAIQQYQEEQGAKITLDQTPSEDTFQKLLRSIQSGNSYDIAGTDPEMYAWLAAGGHLKTMDPLVEKLGGASAFVTNGLFDRSGYYDEFTYALNICGMYYRTDWLQDSGEDVPSTWDDLARVARKFTKDGHYGITQPIAMGQTTNDIGSNVLWSNGVEFFDDEWNVVLDDGDNLDRAVQCLEFLKELEPYFPEGMVSIDYGGVVNTFVNEVAGAVPYMGRLAMEVEAHAPNLADKFVYTGFPTPEQGQDLAATYSSNQWVIPKRSNQADQAADFLGWFVENHYVDFILTLPLHFQPSLKSVYEDARWQNDPLISKHQDMVKTQQRMVEGDGINLSGVTLITPGLGKEKQSLAYGLIIPEMYQRVLVKGDTPQQAVTDSAQKLRGLLEA